jgi:hypothetical protein
VEPVASTVTDGARAGLVEVVFHFKNAIEERNIERVKELFGARPEICVQGRFLTAAEFLERLQAFFVRVEHVSMDVTRIDEVDPEADGGFVAVEVEFGWIDSQLWEEQTVRGALALTLEPVKVDKRRATAETGAGRRVRGLSYAMRRDALDGGGGNGDGGEGPGGGPGPGPGTGPAPSRGYDPIGSIWG